MSREADRRKLANPARVLLIASAFLGGCIVGPDYHPPAALGSNPVPASFEGSNGSNWKTAAPSAHLPRGAWWEVFRDPELNRLEALALRENQELALAMARFEQARALVDVAKSELLPHLGAGSSGTRQRTSANQPQSGKPAGQSYTFNNFLVPITAAWEVDLWGRVRREVEGARARVEASGDDFEAARLSMQAEVATNFFALYSANADNELLQRTVAAYRKSLELTKNRRAGGIATDLEVSQAETQLKTAEAELPRVALQQSKLRHALATLCGQPATGFAVAMNEAVRLPAVPASIPSELLERRPDIAAAERRMAAANADTGVAEAAFYPQLRLSGSSGFHSIRADTLFDWPSRIWAVGPTLELPLFTGGRNRAQLAAAQAAYDATVAQYRQTVLVAFQEVEDQLAAQSLLAAELEAENAALSSARRTLDQANNRYQAGLVTFLEVAVAQSAALTRERTVVQLQSERQISSVALIKSLGGGWMP